MTGMFMLLMAIGMIITQTGIFLVTMQYRARDQQSLALAENARISMSFYRLLASLPTEDRLRLASDFRFPSYHIEILEEPGIVQNDTWQSRRLWTHTSDLINFYKQSDGIQDRIASFTPEIITNVDKVALNWRVSPEDYLHLRSYVPTGDLVADVAISLPDSQWMVVNFYRMHYLDNNLLGMIIELSMQFVLLLFLAYVALRLVTRSMRQLTAYADKIDGDDLTFPMDGLPKNGPEEVRRMAEAYAGLLERVQLSVDERMKVLASLSHDLRNPLHRLRAQIENDSSIAEPELLLKTVDDLQLMAENAIDMARTGRNDEPFYLTDVGSILETIISDYEEQALLQKIPAPNLFLQGAETAVCLVRPQSFKRCLENLIDNALCYGDQARIYLDDLGDEVRIRIEDNGPGIPAEHLQDVFQAFFRSEPSRNGNTGGAGLGLSIARNLARQNNTDIMLDNMPEGGLQACIVLSKM